MSQPRFETSTIPKERRENSPYWAEHVARYCFALSYVANRDTLDVACGDGFGLPILRKSASRVVGVDVDAQAVLNARMELGGGSGHVVIANGCLLPFAASRFRAITSFETLEHLEHRGQFIAELRRVLAPDGICIISTPNAKYTLPVNGKPKNPFHVHEYTPEELKSELAKSFARVMVLGECLDQRFVMPPFWEQQERLAEHAGLRKQVLFWRALRRLPFPSVRNRLSTFMWGHPFLPGETDYNFVDRVDETVPVLVALCHNDVA